MSKRKFRNQPPSRALFVAWWALSYTAFCTVLWGLLEISPSTALNWPMCTIGTVVMMAMISTFQAQLGQWVFKRSMQSWIDAGNIGSLLTIVLLAALSSSLNSSWAVAVLTVPMAFVQTVWLARHSKWAWLWPLANLLILLPAAQYPQLHQQGLFATLIPVVGLIQGLTQGLLISHLWAALPRQGKPKSLAFSDQSEEERAAIQRLSLPDSADEVIVDEQPRVISQSRQADLS